MILKRYILKNIFFSATTITFVVCSIVAMIESLRLLDLLINGSIHFGQFLLMITLLLPQYIATILPFTLFAATISTYLRLAQNKELTIIKSTGVSNLGLLMPAIKMGVLATVGSIALYSTVIPLGFSFVQVMKYDAKNGFMASMIPPSKFIAINKNLTVFAKKVSGLTMFEILIYQSSPDGNLQILTAKKGGIISNDEKSKIVLYNGVQQSGKLGDSSITTFDTYTIDVNVKLTPYRQNKDIAEYTSYELAGKMKHNNAYRAEFYNRLFNASLNIIFVILAAMTVILFQNNRSSYNKHISIATVIMLASTSIAVSFSTKSFIDNTYILYQLGFSAFIFSVLIAITVGFDMKFKLRKS